MKNKFQIKNKKSIFTLKKMILSVLLLATSATSALADTADISNDRGILVDLARHPLTKYEVKGIINSASASKFNYIDLHLSDDENISFIPYFSDDEPNSEKVLSSDDLRDIVSYAKSKNMYIVPDVELPAHAKALLLSLQQKQPDKYKQIIMDGMDNAIDYEKAESVTFAENLYSNINAIFGQQDKRYFLIGTDEVPGDNQAYTHLIQYINNINRFENEHGFQTIIWNDSILKSEVGNLDSNVIVSYWSQAGNHTESDELENRKKERADVPDLINTGHSIINSNGKNYYFDTAYAYDEWSIDNFIDNIKKNAKPNRFNEINEAFQNNDNTEESVDNSGYLLSFWGEGSEGISIENIEHLIDRLSVLTSE